MTKLNDVIGAFMAEIAKAQAVSDSYSRTLQESYKADVFLKLLPVPRTTVKQVVVDLKFAILSPAPDFMSYLTTDYKGSGVKGNNVKIVGAGDTGNSASIIYRQSGGAEWIRENLKDKPPRPLTYFRETGRDEWSVFLQSSAADTPSVRVQIDLWKQQILTQTQMSAPPTPVPILSAGSSLPDPNSKSSQDEIDIEFHADQLSDYPDEKLSKITLTLDLNTL